MKHLVFYDGSCGLCDHVVQFLLKADRQEDFAFAPLQGTTAAQMLKELPEKYKGVDSLVLIEDYQGPNPQFYVMGKASLRISWLLGGWWTLLGWMSFLPSFLFDFFYRIVARNRHRFFSSDVCALPDPASRQRFLP